MTIKAILSHKGTAVIAIAPMARLCDAIQILDEHQIGAVVITDADQQVVGILCGHSPTTLEVQALVSIAMSQLAR